MNSNLCPHKQSPRTCLQCFRAPKPQQQRPTQQPAGPDVPQNALGAPMVRGHGPKPAPTLGDRSGANVGVPGVSAPQATDEEREKYRYPQGRPRFAPGQDRPVQPTAHTTQQPGTFDAEGLWTPAAKPQLMDQLPSHPKAPVPR